MSAKPNVLTSQQAWIIAAFVGAVIVGIGAMFMVGSPSKTYTEDVLVLTNQGGNCLIATPHGEKFMLACPYDPGMTITAKYNTAYDWIKLINTELKTSNSPRLHSNMQD